MIVIVNYNSTLGKASEGLYDKSFNNKGQKSVMTPKSQQTVR